MKLFPKEQIVGIFRGFKEGGFEFHADLVLPYRSDFQSSPMHGQFLLVQLEHEDEAVLGRITSISAQGRLASGPGEDYGMRAVAEDRPIPEDLREQYLKYQVDIRVLGVLRVDQPQNKLVFAPSHRRLPHVGSKVAFLSDEILKEVAGHNLSGPEIGWYALGEFIYSGDDNRLDVQPWMRIWTPKVVPRFDVQQLVSRRTFVFARAGFGKSNLIKLLFSNLYSVPPSVGKRGGTSKPIGTIIFDRDGEYFWPDDKGRPGMCDVKILKDQLVVFTSREAPSPFYSSFVAGDIRLDIRRLRPSDVLSIALSPEKQDQQNVRKLKGLKDSAWAELVDEIYQHGNFANPDTIKQILGLESDQDAEMVAARANMTVIVKSLHNPSSQMIDMLLHTLRDGKLCIIDVSQIRGSSALILSGLILQRIFDHNQEEFTKKTPETIPTIAVIEEAQSVLDENASSKEGPYVTWVKEGRKYDLGAVLITQQPGSISRQILSQGDNWFIFHLLSSGDLMQLKRANSHFSADLLSSLLNEPIIGNGVCWSSASGKPYPIPIRVLSFEKLYSALDPTYNKPSEEVYAKRLRGQFTEVAKKIGFHVQKPVGKESVSVPAENDVSSGIDMMQGIKQLAIESARKDELFLNKLKKEGMPWIEIVNRLEGTLPDELQDKNRLAYNLVPIFLKSVLGEEGKGWRSERRPSRDGTRSVTWAVPIDSVSK